MASVGAMPIKCHEPTVMALAHSVKLPDPLQELRYSVIKHSLIGPCGRGGKIDGKRKIRRPCQYCLNAEQSAGRDKDMGGEGHDVPEKRVILLGVTVVVPDPHVVAADAEYPVFWADSCDKSFGGCASAPSRSISIHEQTRMSRSTGARRQGDRGQTVTHSILDWRWWSGGPNAGFQCSVAFKVSVEDKGQ
ncbi:hypothetical protein B0H13DRAFT_2291071 [Mycena leptocephala]|nr:hypothetical protein B0H13DRAFT_2291071 [Mycena leptocephala]